MRLLVSLILMTQLAANVAHGECGAARLDLDPKSLGNVPAWQQRKISACAAYAATQLIDAERASKSNGPLRSLTAPIELAVRSVDVFGGGGFIEDALQSARLRGTCDAETVRRAIAPADDSAFITTLSDIYSKSRGQSIKKQNQFGTPGSSKSKSIYSVSDGDFFGSLSSDRMIARLLGDQNALEHRLTARQQKGVEETLCYLSTLGTRNQVDRMKLPVENWIQLDRKTFVTNILNKICVDSDRSRVQLPATEIIPVSFLKANVFEAKVSNLYSYAPAETLITRKLQSKKPVAINFCNEVVLDRGHQPMMIEGQKKCRSDGEHAAVIVGSRRSIIGTCEFLVRDSYCTEYGKRLTAMGKLRNLLPLSNGASKKDYVPVCDKGQYWINSTVLMENTESLVMLKN